MAPANKDDILKQLSKLVGPDRETDIVAAGMVSDIFLADGKAMFSITVAADKAQAMESLRKAAQDAVMALDGVSSVMVALTAERKPGQSPAPQRPPQVEPGRKPHGGLPRKAPVEGIKKIIAVASGKGGVGKSTTSVNLALALSGLGLRVGVLDADIYGPSMPRLLNITERPQPGEQGGMKPIMRHGLKVMSIGFLVDEDTPVIWRGPMVMSALTQMMREVEWGEIDILVTDMPPGTGDAQLTMAQSVPLAGAVIVSTPQDLALIDARRGIAMFSQVDVPVLGIVENMSTFICPKCGEQTDIFGHGGARKEAEKRDLPFLGAVPLDIDIRVNSDAGTPVVTSQPDGRHARIYREIAEKIATGLEADTDRRLKSYSILQFSTRQTKEKSKKRLFGQLGRNATHSRPLTHAKQISACT